MLTGHVMTPGFVTGLGMRIKPDGWRRESRLQEGDEYVDSGYHGCQFRTQCIDKVWGPAGVAMNITLTGRVPKFRDGAMWLRCRIEYVGDCEESTFDGGWVEVAYA